jgi:hypothetical protein
LVSNEEDKRSWTEKLEEKVEQELEHLREVGIRDREEMEREALVATLGSRE